MRLLFMAKYSIDKRKAIIKISAIFSVSSEKRALTMLLDTGASYTMIPWEAAEALGLRPELSNRKANMITASGIEKVPIVMVDSIACLGKIINNSEVMVHDLPQRSHVDGLLGLSFLKHFKLTIDFREGWLEIG